MLAVEATAAIGAEVQGGVIAGLHARDAIADGFHNTGAFMAADDWQGKVGQAFHHVPVAVADAAGHHLDQHFAGLWWLQVYGFNLEGRIGFGE